MKKLLAAALVAAAFSAHADKAQVRLLTNDIHGHPNSTMAVATFELNADGTIAAFIESIGFLHWFGFHSPERFSQSDLPEWSFPLDPIPGLPYETGWHFSQISLKKVSWTIGEPGQFTSVMDAFLPLGGKGVTATAYDHTGNKRYTGFGEVSVIPEPSTYALMLLGLVALGLGKTQVDKRRSNVVG